MIQTAAPSVSSSLSLAAAIKGAPADDAAASGDFAALLDAKVSPDAAGAADSATALQAALGLQVRQAAGSVAGKKLPGEAADTAAALADAAAQIGDGTGKDGEAALDPALTLPATDIVLPGFVVPAAIQVQQTPAAAIIAASPAGDAPGQSIRTMPTTSQPALAAALALKAQAGKPGAEAGAKPETAPTITLDPAAAAAPADPALARTVANAAAQPVAATAPAANTVATAAALAAQANGQGNGITTASDAAAKRAPGQTVSAAAGKPATDGATSTLAKLTANQQVQANTEATPAATKAADPSTVAQAQARVVTTDTVLTDAVKADTRTATIELGAAEATAAPAPVLQTPVMTGVMAAQDGQSLTQTVAAVSTAPDTNAVQSGHDFATLVDRLVEAREAANPNTVHASLNHAEFGQVSLRIDQDAKGLSVAMSSADPEFASAVQASAASAQAQTSSDDRSNQQRQDTQSQLQQQGASLTGQSQSQSQSQAFGRDERDNQAAQTLGETRGVRANEKSTIIDDTADTRSGIYA